MATNKNTGKGSTPKLLLAILIAGGIIGFYLGQQVAQQQAEESKPELKTLDVTVLQKRLDKISELSTISYSYTDISTHTKSESLWGYKIPFSTSKIILRYDGVIKAGVDLHNARIDVVDTVVTFTLPRPTVLSHSVDPSSIKIMNQSNGIFSSIKITDFQAFCAAHQDSMQQVAIAEGLLDRAADNAADGLELIAAPLRDMGYHVDIVIESEEGKTDEQPSIETPTTDAQLPSLSWFQVHNARVDFLRHMKA